MSSRGNPNWFSNPSQLTLEEDYSNLGWGWLHEREIKNEQTCG